MNPLEYHTSEELVAELMRRNTFAGIVIRSTEEVKKDINLLQGWQVSWKGINLEQLSILLKAASMEANNILR